MTQSKIKTLVEVLLEKTLSKEVIWQKTSNDEEFKLALKTGALTIDKWENNYIKYVEVALYNDNGDKIDVLQGTDSVNDMETFDLLDKFHTAIRRAHYKVDEAIDEFLNEINNGQIIGKKEETDDLPF